MESISQHSNQQVLTQRRNKVLQDTYWLLALSLVPTVIGAWIGLSFGLLSGLSGWPKLIIFFAGAYGLMFAIEKNKTSSLGVALLMVFTFFMGVMMTDLLAFVLAKTGGASIVLTAAMGTAGIFFAMAFLATTIKRDISSVGSWLTVGIIVCIAMGILNFAFFSSGILSLALSSLVILISSGFMLYTTKAVIDGGETNYISATLSLYVSLYNVFTSLLNILSIFGDD